MNNDGHVFVLRHGQTEWAKSGQHTGRTNIPLTEDGLDEADAAGDRLAGIMDRLGVKMFDKIYSSPLDRAYITANRALNGLKSKDGYPGIVKTGALLEWDYGRAEGRTRQAIDDMRYAEYASSHDVTIKEARQAVKPWNVWKDGPKAVPECFSDDWDDKDTFDDEGIAVHVHIANGETLEEVYARVSEFIENEVRPKVDKGENVLLVAHSHVLRILTTAWLKTDPLMGEFLDLGTAEIGVLGYHKGQPVIKKWGV